MKFSAGDQVIVRYSPCEQDFGWMWPEFEKEGVISRKLMSGGIRVIFPEGPWWRNPAWVSHKSGPW